MTSHSPITSNIESILHRKELQKQLPLCYSVIQGDAKKRELLKNPTKIEEIQQKKFIDRN